MERDEIDKITKELDSLLSGSAGEKREETPEETIQRISRQMESSRTAAAQVKSRPDSSAVGKPEESAAKAAVSQVHRVDMEESEKEHIQKPTGASRAKHAGSAGGKTEHAAKERSPEKSAPVKKPAGEGKTRGRGVHADDLAAQTAAAESRVRTRERVRRQDTAVREEDQPDRGRSRKVTRTWTRPGDGLLVAFVVPVVVMIIIFAQRKIFPFGEESFLRTDMYHQYAPFFSEFQNKLTHGGSLLYSWDVGMGVNFSALYAYYLASPLNWLLVLCPKSLIIEFMTYSIVLKIGLCGLSFAYYLRKHSQCADFGVGYFGIFYALSGYMAAYSWNIMWLDCIILFPLIMLGLERMVKGKSGLMYCVTLGLCILSNYYISIMICIFMVLYFIALHLLEKRKPAVVYVASSLRFAVFSLAAGGLSAVVLLPEIYALQMTASGDFNFPQTLTSYFSIFDMLARHIGNVQTEIGLDHWPNIYCGVAVLMFFLLYLGCKKISVREKTVYCSLLLIFFASFSINILNFIWHGFHYPNSLPCRQSFIYIALLLLMCYRAYMYLSETPWKHVVIAFWGAVCFVLLAEKMVTQTHFHFIVYYVAIMFLAAYAGTIYLYQTGKMKPQKVLLLALGLVMIEAAVNTTVTSVTSTSRTNYTKDNKEVARLLKDYINDKSFYRVDKVPQKTKNDGAWMNFPSVSTFSSTANAQLSKFFKSVGCESSTNAYSITGSTPLVDMLFSIKYRLYDREQMRSQNMKLLGRDNNTYLYENLYTLPLGFLVPDNFDVDWQTSLGNPADVQNNLSDVVGASKVLEEVAGESSGSSLTFSPETAGEYYVYVSNSKVKDVTATIGDHVENFSNVNRGFLLELGYCEAGTKIRLESDDKEQEMTASVYRFSDTGLKEIYEKLNQIPFQVTRWEDSRVEGKVETDRVGMIMMTIPFDKGWQVKVDGQNKGTRKVMDTFLGFYVPEGTHTITMTYEPEGLRTGMIITFVSLLFVAVSAAWGCAVRRKQVKKQKARREQS